MPKQPTKPKGTVKKPAPEVKTASEPPSDGLVGGRPDDRNPGTPIKP